ncbi:ECF RNA polymerase sigma factor SigE [Allorhodopirellula heiligendammensis]|uniref:ECF RNA polymerase sigma factor SigE n=2 Tax=Allorhodopirellula heiligendammensis TaxID=2714739 RepID=A0A5C6BDT3_9BACT|nr:ECF RNA polymerase sigma factor SigE [Allorhodopirellula heiligendammensis]
MLANPEAEQAWNEFVRLYHDIIFRVAQARGLQAADAEDVTQEVFVIVSRKVGGFDCAQPGSFRGWLHKLARDTAIDRLRQPAHHLGAGGSQMLRALKQHFVTEDTATLWDVEVKREQLLRACDHIRDQFSETVWQSFWLTAIERLSIPAAAAQLEKSPGSIRVARCRVMARLKKEVESDDRKFPL